MVSTCLFYQRPIFFGNLNFKINLCYPSTVNNESIEVLNNNAPPSKFFGIARQKNQQKIPLM